MFSASSRFSLRFLTSTEFRSIKVSAILALLVRNLKRLVLRFLAPSSSKCEYFWHNSFPLLWTNIGRNRKIGRDHTSRSHSIRAESMDMSVDPLYQDTRFGINNGYDYSERNSQRNSRLLCGAFGNHLLLFHF
jgi:hypothetical protein